MDKRKLAAVIRLTRMRQKPFQQVAKAQLHLRILERIEKHRPPSSRAMGSPWSREHLTQAETTSACRQHYLLPDTDKVLFRWYWAGRPLPTPMPLVQRRNACAFRHP